MGKQYERLNQVAKQQQQQIEEMRQREKQRAQPDKDGHATATTTTSQPADNANDMGSAQPNDRTVDANSQAERVEGQPESG